MSQSYTVTWTGPAHRVVADPGLDLTKGVPKQFDLTPPQFDALAITAGITIEPVPSISAPPEMSRKLRAVAEEALTAKLKPADKAPPEKSANDEKARKSTKKEKK
jgi:hypothetical protein